MRKVATTPTVTPGPIVREERHSRGQNNGHQGEVAQKVAREVTPPRPACRRAPPIPSAPGVLFFESTYSMFDNPHRTPIRLRDGTIREFVPGELLPDGAAGNWSLMMKDEQAIETNDRELADEVWDQMRTDLSNAWRGTSLSIDHQPASRAMNDREAATFNT